VEWAILRNDANEFSNAIQDEPATARIPMLDLTGEVGGNGVKTNVLCVVDIVDGSGEIGGDGLLFGGQIWRRHESALVLICTGVDSRPPYRWLHHRCE